MVSCGGKCDKIHDGIDWKERPALSLRITDGNIIDTTSAYTMEYLALTLATQIHQYTKGSGIYSDCHAVVKIIRKQDEYIYKRDCSAIGHRHCSTGKSN